MTATKTKPLSIVPLSDRVVIRRIKADEKTPGGILLPETAKEKPREGVVLAVGPGLWQEGQRAPVDVRPNDRVLFSSYAGTEVKLNGEEFLIVRADDIMGVVK